MNINQNGGTTPALVTKPHVRAGTSDDGSGSTDTLDNVENASGSPHDGLISGNEPNNVLDGATPVVDVASPGGGKVGTLDGTDPPASLAKSAAAPPAKSENTDLLAAADDTVLRSGVTDTIPGDTSTGYSIALEGSVTGTISPQTDLDWFQVTLAAGESYSFTLDGSGASPLEDPYLRLHDSSGAQIAYDDDGGTDLNSQLLFNASTSGTYYVSAGAYQDSFYDNIGDYTLSADIAVVAPDTVPGDTSTDASLTIGESVTGNINIDNDLDWFQVTLNGGEAYTFSLDGSGASPLIDPYLRLHDSSGTQVAFNDDSGSGMNSIITYSPMIGGTYYLSAGAYQSSSHDNIGDYTLSADTWTLPPDTVAGDTSTDASLAIGESVTGTLSPRNDQDWFQVSLSAGERYNFYLDGTGASPLNDPTLLLYDPSGAMLEYDNDGGTGLNSRISHTASTDGTYYVAARGNAGGIGDYTLSASAIDEWSLSQIADYLTAGYWGGGERSFATGTVTFNIDGLTAEGQALAVAALDVWDDVANLTFTQTSGSAQITFDDEDSGAYSWSSVSGTTISSSFVNVSTAWLDSYGTGTYSYSNQAYIHEIGHALGLGHGGPYNGWATYGVDNIYANDSWAYSIMSYFDQDESGYGSYRFVVTPQLSDIVAIQNLYGAATTRTGDTTYGFNSNAGDLFDLTTYDGAPAMTVYDSAGNDTLDFSGYSNDQTINLQAGTFSSVGSFAGNVAIALNSTFENAVGGAGDDTITGNSAANILDGGAGNDTLIGGAGDDTLTGGAGDDTYVVDSISDAVVEASGGGTDTVRSSVSRTLSNFVEILILTGTAALSATGNTLANTITGNSGDNVLDGGAGDDVLSGGGGDDTYVIDSVSDQVVEAAAGGTDTVRSSLSWTLGAQVENLVLTGLSALNGIGNALANVLTGNAAANVLTGGGGDDTLDGGAGDDTLAGGTGDDTYLIDSMVDQVTEGAAEGTDTVRSSASFTLGANLENLILTGSANVDGTGNAQANALTGNSGDNTLAGGGAADALDGGAGTDTADYSASALAVIVSLDAGMGSAGDANGDTLVNIEDLVGSAFADLLAGDGGANSLTGGAGNDTLYGKAGNDTLSGGDGVDRLVGDDGDDTLTGGAGDDTLTGKTDDDTLNGGVGDDFLAGDGGDDALDGGDDDDILYGAAGADTLDGGAGNDRLKGGTGNDAIDGGAGTDVLSYGSTVDGFFLNLTGAAVNVTVADGAGGTVVSLAAGTAIDAVTFGQRTPGAEHIDTDTVTGVETVIAGGGADTIHGGSADETFYGGPGSDTFYGGAGADRLSGHEGNDVLWGEAGADILTGGGDNDELRGGNGDDTLAGDAGDDTLYGDGNNDTIYGGLGADLLWGGAGEDRLVGHAGNDVLRGEADKDKLFGGDGVDTLYGGGANDFLAGDAGNDALYGEGANDTLFGGTGDDTLDGGDGYDRLNGGDGADILVGGAEKDWLYGGNDIDTINGGTGNDILAGNAGNDILNGDEDDDTLFGDSGTDTLNGGAGDDRLKGGAGNDTLDGGAGSDTAAFNDSTSAVTASLITGQGTGSASIGTDTLVGIENLWGSRFVDTLTGDGGDNVLTGGASGDTLIGGAGNDTAAYSGSASAVTVDLLAATWSGGDSTGDTLTSIESLTGSDHDDTLSGDGGLNVLTGGAGADTLTGNGGSDIFRYTAATDSTALGRDVIADFAAAVDTEDIQLDGFTVNAGVGFAFLGDETNAFSGGDDNAEARFNDISKLLEFDTDGDGSSDLEVTLTGVDLADLDLADFSVS